MLAAFLILIAAARVIATYRVFSQTADEPAHVAAGMEWLDKQRYTIDITHPPLSRLAFSLVPFLEGARFPDTDNLVQAGNDLFHWQDRYRHNLASARLGNLPFLILACIVVFSWAGQLFGRNAALAALAFFSTLPPVLAHAGLATTDMAVTACLPIALFNWWRWLERPTIGRGVLLGLTLGLAILAKFSTLLFFPAAATAMLLVSLWQTRARHENITGSFERVEVGDPSADPLREHGRSTTPRSARRSAPLRLRSMLLAIVAGFLLVWAGYRFSFETLHDAHPEARAIIDHFAARISLGEVPAGLTREWQMPAPALILGAAIVQRHNESGHDAYLLGDYRRTGWWYYFPVALLVKTPIPFLFLLVYWFAIVLRKREVDREAVAVSAAAVAVLAVCLTSRINIGVRHILPIYPLLSILAGRAAILLWQRYRSALGRLAVGLLFFWQAGTGIVAHPDYLPYFNKLGGDHPELVLLDSNLDWGQDLIRLKKALKRWHVDELHIAYAGSADLGRHDLPRLHELKRYEPVTGWVAISETKLKDPGSPQDRGEAYGWLRFYNPVARVGRSILLYYIPKR